ncbi:MAG: serine/threonine phosphatase [Cyanobacteriota bacterium]|nr:serine/threonine phosphatase [Cyanobacteriota bacterium]
MLVCPQCKFENPNNHKFCQKCGASLTHKKCDSCGSEVAWSEKKCDNCGAFTGLVWMAVLAKNTNKEFEMEALGTQEEPLAGAISKSQNSAASARDAIESAVSDSITQGANYESGSLLEIESTTTAAEGAGEFENLDIDLPGGTSTENISENISGEIEESESGSMDKTEDLLRREEPENLEGREAPYLGQRESLELPEAYEGTGRSQNPAMTPGQYIDSQKRYQLLETLSPRKPGDVELARVLDCQPLQISLLKALLVTREMPAQQANIPSGAQTLVKSENTGIEALVTPEIAKGYLELKCKFPYHLPAVHDAWQQKGEQVVLLEDCSAWSLLSQLWENDRTGQLQLVDWLYEMSELWIALGEWNCRQSLLELDNLRVYPYKVGDSQPVCLQRLYSDTEEIKLEGLMELWLDLFHRSQRTLFGPLADFVHDLRSGNIKEIEEVRSRLESTREQLTQEEESNSPGTVLQSEESLEGETTIGEQSTSILAKQLVSLESVGRTHVGKTREHNEDFFGIQTNIEGLDSPDGRTLEAKGLYIICDGMGGHAGGEIASKLAVDVLKQYFTANWRGDLPSESTIREGIFLANQAIYDVNQEEVRSGSARMGTTLVMAMVRNAKFAIAHVGDSRIYRFTRSRGLQQLTVDHEVGQREIKRGVDPKMAYSRPDAYQLTQALGPRDEDYVMPEVQFFNFDEDTVLILASDGLTDNDLLENHYQSEIAPLLEPQSNLEEGVQQAIELANEENGHDNITVIAIVAKVQPGRL